MELRWGRFVITCRLRRIRCTITKWKMRSSADTPDTEETLSAPDAHVARPGRPRSARTPPVTAADGWELTPKLRMGQRLRDLRGSMDGKDLAPLVGISADLVSRIERGERWPQPVNVEAWARQTGHPDLVDELQLLREELRQDDARLRADAQRPKVAQELRSGFFRRSSRIRTLAVTNMPWYLQTAEYTRAEIGETPGVDDVIQLRRAGHDMVGKHGKY